MRYFFNHSVSSSNDPGAAALTIRREHRLPECASHLSIRLVHLWQTLAPDVVRCFLKPGFMPETVCSEVSSTVSTSEEVKDATVRIVCRDGATFILKSSALMGTPLQRRRDKAAVLKIDIDGVVFSHIATWLQTKQAHIPREDRSLQERILTVTRHWKLFELHDVVLGLLRARAHCHSSSSSRRNSQPGGGSTVPDIEDVLSQPCLLTSDSCLCAPMHTERGGGERPANTAKRKPLLLSDPLLLDTSDSSGSSTVSVTTVSTDEQEKRLPPHQNALTPSEIQCHASPESCYIVADGIVYDVTPVLSQHPGGICSILRHGGGRGDCSEHLRMHSGKARAQWRQCIVGHVAGDATARRRLSPRASVCLIM